jgi:hypothetical protein
VAAGAEPFDAAARAKVIAPLLDGQTFAVAHVDVTRVSLDPLCDELLRLVPDAKDVIAAGKSQLGSTLAAFLRAGGKDIYVVFTFAAGLREAPLVGAIPLYPRSDEKAIWATLGRHLVCERRGEMLLVAEGREALQRTAGLTPDPRPELAAAFEAAGDTAAQVLLLPPKYSRRVIEETTPELPKELGGGESRVLTRGLLWAALGIDAPPQTALRLVIQSEDAAAAEALRARCGDLLRLVAQAGGGTEVLPQVDQLAALVTPSVEGDRLVLRLDEKTRGISTLIALLKPPLEGAQADARRPQSMNNLKLLGLAMHNYHDAHKHFPPPASYSPDGKPLLSWRVQLLPFLEEEKLYKEFHFDEAWDSRHNRALIEKMPDVYRSPMSKRREKGWTNYVVPVGGGAVFSSPFDTPTFKDITDGCSRTILAVEADDDHAVPWTKPDDLPFDPEHPEKGLGGLYKEVFHVLMCDGSARRLSRSIKADTLRALFTRAGGDVVHWEDL